MSPCAHPELLPATTFARDEALGVVEVSPGDPVVLGRMGVWWDTIHNRECSQGVRVTGGPKESWKKN
jgi:hypothetical protein